MWVFRRVWIALSNCVGPALRMLQLTQEKGRYIISVERLQSLMVCFDRFHSPCGPSRIPDLALTARPQPWSLYQ